MAFDKTESMLAVRVSASMVLYRPDLAVVESALQALNQSIRHALQLYQVECQLTIVDNSADAAVFLSISNWFEGIRKCLDSLSLVLIRAPENLGYGKGHNLVIDQAESDYHIVINPDLFVTETAMQEALRYMLDQPEVGLLTPAVFGKNGERHYLCKRNPTLLIMFLRSFAPDWLRHLLKQRQYLFEMRDCDYDKSIYPVEYPTGSFMFFRTEVLKKIGGFDPAIFLHYEDADIGRRMLALARVVYVPLVRVQHFWARDTHKSWRAKWITMKSGWYYWRKWGGLWCSAPMRDPQLSPQHDLSVDEPNPTHGNGRRILVTGANGFIGRAICAELPKWGYTVRAVVRQHPNGRNSNDAQGWSDDLVMLDSIDNNTDWRAVLKGVDCVIHLAAKVHETSEPDYDLGGEYRRINVELTTNLARQAAAAGVRRFVFISSIKVNGENTPVGQPFTAEDKGNPQGAYANSKRDAEDALLKLASLNGMDAVIIRPPLVYGPGVRANFQTMMHWLKKGIPLPLGGLHNRRSMVSLDNLVSLINRCINHPKAANQVFLASDGEDLSIKELLLILGGYLGTKDRLFTLPALLLEFASSIIQKSSSYKKMSGTLQVDFSKNFRLLEWQPKQRVDQALALTARSYLTNSQT